MTEECGALYCRFAVEELVPCSLQRTAIALERYAWREINQTGKVGLCEQHARQTQEVPVGRRSLPA